MANQPAAWRQAVTWRLARDLVEQVKARAADRGETVLAFVTRALKRELEEVRRETPPSGHS
jgi:predicted DNA binding CopG/RHH family protein